jgi:deoxyribodipyrimidine photo-lyase
LSLQSRHRRDIPTRSARMTKPISLVWFRRDLRLEDNLALRAAKERGGSVVPVFLWSPHEEAPWSPGAASRWWLHHSLKALEQSLTAAGSRLVLRAGDSLATLRQIVAETGADAVYWNRLYEPAVVARDKQIKQSLKDAGVQVESLNGNLLREPWEVATGQGQPYQVFTPYWKACRKLGSPRESIARPRALSPPVTWPESLELGDLGLLPRIPWDRGFYDRWTPGEEGAGRALREFLKGPIEDYARSRDVPSEAGTSSLSPHLHFGEISPVQIWEAVAARHGPPEHSRNETSGPMTFLKELGWREFAHHVLYHFPHTSEHPLRKAFEELPWRRDHAELRAWQRGLTGYPIVDAGLRELWTTGWMHNRVRMIVGSFLAKDLLHSWRDGAEWFWDTLVDADLANNTLGWQWVSGCGADAAPFFRIFNPVTQGEKFDPRGAYVRRWVTELARLPDKWLHHPWNAPPDVMAAAGVKLGQTYPTPIVDHGEARARALQVLATIRSS